MNEVGQAIIEADIRALRPALKQPEEPLSAEDKDFDDIEGLSNLEPSKGAIKIAEALGTKPVTELSNRQRMMATAMGCGQVAAAEYRATLDPTDTSPVHFTGFDDCLLGYGYVLGADGKRVQHCAYSAAKLLKALRREGMSKDKALQALENMDVYVGPQSPIVVWKVNG